MRVPLIAFVLAAVPAFPSVASADRSARPEVELALVQYGRGVAAKVEVAGRERLFQLDTAGGLTVVTPATAKAIGCEPWGRIVGFHMRGFRISGSRCDDVRIRWGGTELRAPVAAVLPLGKPEAPLDGLLALDVFAGRTVTIDFARLKLVVESPASAASREREAVEVPAHLAREVGGVALSAFIDVPARHGPLRFELDSGNEGPNVVSKPLLAELGLDPVSAGGQPARLRVAPNVTLETTLWSPDLVIDGNLGMSLLKDWVVTMDLGTGRVWLRRSGVASPPGMGVLPPPPTDQPATNGKKDSNK